MGRVLKPITPVLPRDRTGRNKYSKEHRVGKSRSTVVPVENNTISSNARINSVF